MSNEVRCGDPATLAGFVYDECGAGEREAMLAHLARCGRCTAAVTALRGTRSQIAQWSVPSVELGFRVSKEDALDATTAGSDASRVSRAGWFWSGLPAWTQAAAAVALFACGAVTAAVMNLEVRHDQAGLTMRTGWTRPAPAAVVDADDAALQARIREEVTRVQNEMADQVEQAEAPAAPLPASLTDADEVLQQVRALVAESEQRQQEELALRVSQVVRDIDSQRRSDIARIERTVGPMAGVTTEELQEQRRMLDYLITVSQTK